MILKVMSKKQMKDLLELNQLLKNPENIEGENIAIISIIDPGENRLILHNHKNVLVLEFSDINDETISNSFNQDREVLDFIEKNKYVEMFFVHCTMGVSRSGGIGMFIRDFYLNTNDQILFDRFHKHLVPNTLVYKRLLNRYQHEQKPTISDKNIMTKSEKKKLKKLKKQNLI